MINKDGGGGHNCYGGGGHNCYGGEDTTVMRGGQRAHGGPPVPPPTRENHVPCTKYEQNTTYYRRINNYIQKITRQE